VAQPGTSVEARLGGMIWQREGVRRGSPSTYGCRVVNCVTVTPDIIRRQCQHSDDTSDPVIGETIAEERSVPAIMLDNEEPDE
jgi:hypothetical protein